MYKEIVSSILTKLIFSFLTSFLFLSIHFSLFLFIHFTYCAFTVILFSVLINLQTLGPLSEASRPLLPPPLSPSPHPPSSSGIHRRRRTKASIEDEPEYCRQYDATTRRRRGAHSSGPRATALYPRLPPTDFH